MERMPAVIAEITAENLELKKRSEVGRSFPNTGGDESGRDADRRSNEDAIRVAGVSDTGRLGRAAQRVLRLEEARQPGGPNGLDAVSEACAVAQWRALAGTIATMPVSQCI